jgi:hypothetical protein
LVAPVREAAFEQRLNGESADLGVPGSVGELGYSAGTGFRAHRPARGSETGGFFQGDQGLAGGVGVAREGWNLSPAAVGPLPGDEIARGSDQEETLPSRQAAGVHTRIKLPIGLEITNRELTLCLQISRYRQRRSLPFPPLPLRRPIRLHPRRLSFPRSRRHPRRLRTLNGVGMPPPPAILGGRPRRFGVDARALIALVAFGMQEREDF